MEEKIYAILSSREKRKKVIRYILGALMLSILMIPTKLVLAKMLPGKSANTFSIYVDTATNSSLKQTKDVTDCIASYLRDEKEVENIEIFLGQGAPLDYAGLVKGSSFKRMKNQAEIVVNLTDKNTRDEPSYMMVHRIRPEIQNECADQAPKTTIKFIEMPSGPPTLATIVIELFGTNYEMLRDVSMRIGETLKETEGLVDVDVMQDDIYDFYSIVPDTEKVLRSGLNVEQVNNILYMAFQGMVIAAKNSKIQQDQIPIFLRLDKTSKKITPKSKEGIELKLARLKLMNKNGMLIPVKEVVNIQKTKSNPTRFRKDLKDFAMITAECDMVSQVYPLLDAREMLIKRLSKDFNVTKVPGMSTYMFDLNLVNKKTGEKMLLRWDGEMKVSLDTFRDLGGAFIAALILMFLLMVVYYKSFALSGIVLAASFLSIIGVIVGHFITNIITLVFNGTNFFLTATSLIGFISLMGISARSSLLLIDFSKALIAKGIEKKRAISIATATRAKPILMTAVAIILGSLLLSTDPIFGGLGIALIFGSIGSTVVSLYLVPIMINATDAVCPLGVNNQPIHCKGGLDQHIDPKDLPDELNLP